MGLSVEDLLALAESNSRTAQKKEAPFTSYTVYLNENYIGNFSLPENFTEGTKAVVLESMKLLGLELRAPGATKRELSMTDLLPKTK